MDGLVKGPEETNNRTNDIYPEGKCADGEQPMQS